VEERNTRKRMWIRSRSNGGKELLRKLASGGVAGLCAETSDRDGGNVIGAPETFFEREIEGEEEAKGAKKAVSCSHSVDDLNLPGRGMC